VATGVSEFRSALRTIPVIVIHFRTATGAPFGASAYFSEVLLPDRHILPMGDGFPELKVKLVQRSATGSLDVVTLAPSEAGDEEQKEHRIGHENPVASEMTANGTLDGLCVIEILPPLADTDHEEHAYAPIRVQDAKRLRGGGNPRT
jgi:hypothetical protein